MIRLGESLCCIFNWKRISWGSDECLDSGQWRKTSYFAITFIEDIWVNYQGKLRLCALCFVLVLIIPRSHCFSFISSTPFQQSVLPTIKPWESLWRKQEKYCPLESDLVLSVQCSFSHRQLLNTFKITGPEGNSWFCFPRISLFPEAEQRETLRIEGSKINCSPRDQP